MTEHVTVVRHVLHSTNTTRKTLEVAAALSQWKINCHLSLSFPLPYSFFICTYKHFSYKHRWHIESSFSLLSSEQARWLCLYFRAAVMLLRSFSLSMLADDDLLWQSNLSVSLLSLLNDLCCAFTVPGPDHLPWWLWIQEGEPVHHRTCLCAEVQGRIQETVLLDAGERKMLLSFFTGEEMETIYLNVCHLCLFVCRLMDI